MSCEKTAEIKVHPLQFFRFLRPFIFILILPTLRRTTQFFLTGEYDIFLPYELFLTLWALFTAFFRTRNFYLEFKNDTLVLGQGVFYQRVSYLKLSGINWCNVNISPLDKILGTKTIKIKTSLSPIPRADLTLTLRKRDANYFLSIFGIK